VVVTRSSLWGYCGGGHEVVVSDRPRSRAVELLANEVCRNAGSHVGGGHPSPVAFIGLAIVALVVVAREGLVVLLVDEDGAVVLVGHQHGEELDGIGRAVKRCHI
jgi:hypothetical protein